MLMTGRFGRFGGACFGSACVFFGGCCGAGAAPGFEPPAVVVLGGHSFVRACVGRAFAGAGVVPDPAAGADIAGRR